MSNRRISGSRKMNGPAVKISSATLSDLTTLEAEGSRMKTKMGPALAAHSLSNQSCTQTDCDCFLNSELLSQSMEGDYSDSYSRRSRRFNSCKKTFADDKKKTVASFKSSSATISELKSNKKYYIRIRTYKTVKVNGKNVKMYGTWSKTKTAATK